MAENKVMDNEEVKENVSNILLQLANEIKNGSENNNVTEVPENSSEESIESEKDIVDSNGIESKKCKKKKGKNKRTNVQGEFSELTIQDLLIKNLSQNLTHRQLLIKKLFNFFLFQLITMTIIIIIIVGWLIFDFSFFKSQDAQIVVELLSFIKYYVASVLVELLLGIIFIVKKVFNERFSNSDVQ